MLLALILMNLIFVSTKEEIYFSKHKYTYNFSDKYHDDWILFKGEESGLMISCLTNCTKDPDCQGLAIDVENKTEDYTRICHTLKKIDYAVCNTDDGGCDHEGFQVFRVRL